MLDLLLLTHSDMDGYGCKLVLDVTMDIVGNNNYTVEACRNSAAAETMFNSYEQSHDIGESTVIIFSDLCPSSDFIERITTDGHYKEIRIYDHHDTNMFAAQRWPDIATIIPDDRNGKLECGTSLLYMETIAYLEGHDNISMNYLDENLYAELVDTIRQYDTYEWKMNNNLDAKRLNMLFTMIGGDGFVKKYIKRLLSLPHLGSMFTETELEFINYKMQYTNGIIHSVAPEDFITTSVRGHKVALLMKSIGANVNEIADFFLELYPEYDAVIQLSMFGEWQFSIRSRRDDFNSAEIFAVPLGGGGHPKACGAPVPRFIKDAITDAVIRYINGEDLTIVIEGRTVYGKDDKNE